MKHLLGIAVLASLLAGCSNSYDGRYPIDTIKMRTEGSGHVELTNETFPLHAWFEIDSENCFRIHQGGVTSVYPHPTIMKTVDGFEALSDNPRGTGRFAWSFDKGEEGGLCSLTLTYDGVHSLVMLSKGKESR